MSCCAYRGRLRYRKSWPSLLQALQGLHLPFCCVTSTATTGALMWCEIHGCDVLWTMALWCGTIGASDCPRPCLSHTTISVVISIVVKISVGLWQGRAEVGHGTGKPGPGHLRRRCLTMDTPPLLSTGAKAEPSSPISICLHFDLGPQVPRAPEATGRSRL